MTTGEVIRISLRLDGVYLVLAKKLRDGYLVAFRMIPALAWEKVGANAWDMPQRDRLDEQLNALRASAGNAPEIETVLRRNYLHTLRFQMVVSALLSAKMNRLPGKSGSELCAPLCTLTEESASLLNASGFHVHFKTPDRPCYAMLDMDALRFALTEVLSFAVRTAVEGNVMIDAVSAPDELCMCYTFEPIMDDELYEGILSGEYSGDLLGGAYSDIFFDLFLAQLLCDRNDFELRVSKVGDSGVVRVSVAVPTVPEEGMLVNCPPDLGDLVPALLHDLLPEMRGDKS